MSTHTLTDTKSITKFPLESLVKGPDRKPVRDAYGQPTGERRTSLIRLRFHLARIVLTHETGTVTILRHSRQDTEQGPRHKVTWENRIPGIRPMTRSFCHPDNLADFLIQRYGFALTEQILTALDTLEQENRHE